MFLEKVILSYLLFLLINLFFLNIFVLIFPIENMFFLVVMVFLGLLMFFLALHNYKKYKNIKKMYHYKLKEMWMNQLNIRQGSKFIFYY